jgi:hypothetical protein
MKRKQGLIEKIADRGNLILAFHKARKGKSRHPEVIRFRDRLEEEVAELRARLLAGDYPVGRYFTFHIRDPKPRKICAAVFPERVLHHAILNICEADFERRLTVHTYACRKGKGRRAAVQAAAEFARIRPWFLKMDVRAYFDSIVHEVLRNQLRRMWKDGVPGPGHGTGGVHRGSGWRWRLAPLRARETPGRRLGRRAGAARRELEQRRGQLRFGLPQQQRPVQPEPEHWLPAGFAPEPGW